jgi:DNA-binding transcriptional regulator LsrR (DeoR family)
VIHHHSFREYQFSERADEASIAKALGIGRASVYRVLEAAP